jgi:hypothetical protein
VSSWEDAVKQQKQQPLDVSAPASDCNARVPQRALEIMKQGHYG